METLVPTGGGGNQYRDVDFLCFSCGESWVEGMIRVCGNWRAVVVIDDRATTQQEVAILNVFTGKLGGPVADVVKLIGEVVSVERAPITFEAEKGAGTLKIGQAVDGVMVPYVSPITGEVINENTPT